MPFANLRAMEILSTNYEWGYADPELPQTLEELNVVTEDEIFVRNMKQGEACIRINFTPTVPHCSLATLIGLCIRVKLQRCLDQDYKLDIYVTKGSHDTEDGVNKQINDKERVAAAIENPNVKKLVEECLQEVQY
ncbi:uncharacterized protein TRIADDRAFT_54797 [Trichoplax adhaerens]|uniref:Uncharacterized protein n=1 Tax=Trichoplax adhaerens TaxID=10228 RepID=B3RT11_TRIAD|nr:hypothetical protein TRIADDRAFT_54797 [Trichoplax adhaerens]EDV27144.1 hypothetical protein TRIADDRAFT_54797 [Trichoplax adhaerens]|eukprot:XP_002111140.1 hypothetical protein TRIADDRAFT_54797 [Trichoplax adhaerens]